MLRRSTVRAITLVLACAVPCARVRAQAPAQAPAIATEGGTWTLVLPPNYAVALVRERVRPLTPRDFLEAFAATDQAAPGAVILPGSGAARHLVVAGLTPDSLVVVLLRPVGAEVSVRRLYGEALPPDERAERRTGRMLSLAGSRGQTWVRWQDGDCKGPGLEWRIAGAAVTRRRSRCSYGE